MRTLIFFLFTLFASYWLSIAALATKVNFIPQYFADIVLWGLFLLYLSRQLKKKRLKRENEEMLNEYLRDRLGRY